ncbi:uncharacterized protein CXorf66 homolog [Erinaceus europaeus]|uniref:Uncharacterized protein CXorf66 homolog n=1 Tax=Erinaceus europaeus TaxID=9365 RepID=A0ABM3WQ64_ERIEU|nr:uncharacterized protein CXorf66 homolog [Erinaceus europaeus]
MENSKKRLLVIVIGVMIIGFVFSCFCLLHYNCMADEVLKSGVIKKDCLITSSSKIISARSQTNSVYGPENQALLSSFDKFAGFPALEKFSLPTSNIEKLIWLSLEKPFLISSSEMFNNPLNLEKPSSPKKEYIECHLLKGHGQKKKSHKSARTRKSARKSAQARNSASSPHLKRAAMATLSESGQYLESGQYVDKSTRSSCPLSLTWPLTVAKLQKWTNRSPLKRSDKPKINKPCRCYKEKCLVCSFSEPLLNDTSEAKENNAQTSLFSSQVQSFSGSIYRVGCEDSVTPYYDISDSDMMAFNSNDESDKEITIICKVNREAIIQKRTQSKERKRLIKNKKQP